MPTKRPQSKQSKNDSDSEMEIVPLQSSSENEFEDVDYQEDVDVDQEQRVIQSSLISANRKGKKSGGFQSMGLSYPVYKAISHMGYKIPTPIQRKSIPLLLQGRDVVAMARTGSGKTAAFIIPLLEKLKAHSAKVGARALILSPSRELAFQTGNVLKQLGKYTDLRRVCLVGGDHMEDQFTSLAGNPDILVATPGRLMHLIIEMKLDLSMVEYVVFDEADRLFEMGFAEQLSEILTHLPRTRQTCLYSATLPKLLVDFAKAGLQNPALVRLDVDTKISQDLQLYFFSVKANEKEAALLYLLRTRIPEDQQCVLFVSTKHHVEYIHNLLQVHGYASTYIYGALDQLARQHHLTLFRNKKARILVVTDVAARGIDIPLLDNVINYDFPGSSKIFIHRVGRTARAGRSGSSWSFISQEELPYMLDLQLFTGRPLVFASTFQSQAEGSKAPSYTSELVYGTLPPSDLSIEIESTSLSSKGNVTLENLHRTSVNSYKMYVKSRPSATSTSYKRAKQIVTQHIGIHPLFMDTVDKVELERVAMVQSLSKFRPAETIFEVGKKKGVSVNAPEALVMMKRRSKLSTVIEKKRETTLKREREELERQEKSVMNSNREQGLEQADDEDIGGLSKHAQKKMKLARAHGAANLNPRPQQDRSQEKEYYLSYTQPDADTEKGYSVHGNSTASSFAQLGNQASFDMMMDDTEGLMKARHSNSTMKWDAKKGKYVKETIGADNKKMIKTDSGRLVPASWNSSRFRDWQKRTNMTIPRVGEAELPESSSLLKSAHVKKYRHTGITAPTANSRSFARKQNQVEAMLRKKGYKGEKLKEMSKGMLQEPVSAKAKEAQKQQEKRKKKSELKGVQQIAKERKVKEQRREKTGRHHGASKGKKRR